MKKTQKSHNSNVRMSLSLEELSAYIEDRLTPKERASVDEFLKENPLYQETLSILQENYDEDPAFLEEVATAESRFEKALDKEVEEVSVKADQAFDPFSSADPVPTSSSWKASAPAKTASEKGSAWYSHNWVKLAASLIVIGGILFIAYQQRKAPSDIQLADAYLTHFSDPLASLSQLEDQAYQLYQNQAYTQAVPAFQQLITQSQGDDAYKHKMFLGVSLLQDAQNEEAYQPLEEIITHGKSVYVGPAKWYLSLAYLKGGDKVKAVALLKELVQEGAYEKTGLLPASYLDKAQELLSRLS